VPAFLLMGSGEFEAWSEEVERAALRRASGDGSVLVLPTASAPEGDSVFEGWASMGLRHYASLGVEALVAPLKTRADAERDAVVALVEGASMAFFSGGNPRYLARTLDGTRLWRALLVALDRGMVYAGCSAGAMVASRSPARRPRIGAAWVSGLDLVPHASFGVHWDRMRYLPGFRSVVMSRRDHAGWFVGIDERTAILGDGARWRVFGAGAVTVKGGGDVRAYRHGEAFRTPA
jgi:cyanophycinase